MSLHRRTTPSALTDGSDAGTLHTHDLDPDLTLTCTDVGGGEGTVVCQVVHPITGANVAGRFIIVAWAGDSDDYLPDAQDAFLASTADTTSGGQIVSMDVNAAIMCVTNASGSLTINVAKGAGGDMYVWASLGGRVYATGAFTIGAA